MNHHVALCYVIALMAVLVAMTHVRDIPRCPSCGTTDNDRHHNDCQWR